MKRGFTLIELSIVLVIIGLLIGGILVAQSMIGTAKLQALVRQVGQFDAALGNFQTKYNQLPGDNNLFGVVKGNNNRAIRVDAGIAWWTGEIAKYWYDLSITGLNTPSGNPYLDESAGAAAVDTNIAQKLPQAVAGTKAYFIVSGYPDINWYVIAQPYARGGAGSEVGLRWAFKPSEALAVDQKMDDGRPGTGNATGNDEYDSLGYLMNNAALIRGAGAGCPSGSCNCTDGAGGAPIAGSSYQVSRSTDECYLAIRLGAASGNLQ